MATVLSEIWNKEKKTKKKLKNDLNIKLKLFVCLLNQMQYELAHPLTTL